MSTHKIDVKWDMNREPLAAPEVMPQNRPKWKCPWCGVFTDWREKPLSCEEHVTEQMAAILAQQIDEEFLQELLKNGSTSGRPKSRQKKRQS